MKALAIVDQNWGLGYQGDQIVYLKQDLKRFKNLTLGKVIIYGRKTLKTFPKARPLAGRLNLMLSHSCDRIEGLECYENLEALLTRLQELENCAYTQDDFVLIGGASLYQQLIGFCDDLLLTVVHECFPADCWFPNPETHGFVLWEQSDVQEEQGLKFSYCHYRREGTGNGD